MSAGAAPETPLGGGLQRSPGLAGLKGPTSKRGEGLAEEKGGEGRKENERGRKRR